MSNDQQSLSFLIQEMLDGKLDDDQREELLKRIESDDKNQQIYFDQISTHTALQAVLADCIPQREILSDQTYNKRGVSSRFNWVIVASIAASFLILLSSIAFFGATYSNLFESTKVPHIAVVTDSVGAYREGNIAIQQDENIHTGLWTLERGVVRLDFVSGASIAVEGPAILDVVDDMHVVLKQGIVTASIPDSAIGFVVDTKTAHVVDLGTAFGVSVSDDGITDVCVFEGEVSVRKQNKSTSNSTLVRQGQAVRTSEQSPTIDSTNYVVDLFKGAWPINSGVLQTTGSLQFVSPGPDFHPGSYEDNQHIVVFPERKNVLINESLRVDLVDPGQYVKSTYQDKKNLLTDKKITSYLLQFNAHATEEFGNRKRLIRGQITFSKPILGVISSARLLQESEDIFGNPEVEYPVPRSVEPRPEGDARPGFDTVTLAADQRTLILDLSVAPNKLDQLRVLIAAE